MNTHIYFAIKNQKLAIINFKNACLAAAMKDDGKVSKSEQKIINEINKASDKYQKELDRICAKYDE